MPLINCKTELKLKWTKYCILSTNGNDSAKDKDDANNISFTIKNTKLYVFVVTFSAKYYQKLSKLLCKGFEISVYWNKYKTKSENKYGTNKYGYFHESNFVGVNRLFELIYLNRNNDVKRFNARKYNLPKVLSKIITLLSMKKTFMSKQLILI